MDKKVVVTVMNSISTDIEVLECNNVKSAENLVKELYLDAIQEKHDIYNSFITANCKYARVVYDINSVEFSIHIVKAA